MIELALHDSGVGMFQKDIARSQDISVKYLDQIITTLKAAGLIVNAGGKKSGYLLTRSPAAITVFDIFSAFEPQPYMIECLSQEEYCSRSQICAAKDFWNEFNTHIKRYLQSVTLEELKKKQLDKIESTKTMYFI
jgi:Rrf2 family protein